MCGKKKKQDKSSSRWSSPISPSSVYFRPPYGFLKEVLDHSISKYTRVGGGPQEEEEDGYGYESGTAQRTKLKARFMHVRPRQGS
ncbi:predicted protein [Lichtheimia corymbifera JMRC:FSU:9682]|uniref:Uncharacterized protein n=1 Tax=Lichtheimia corymbifera JMRC:FSU:9682 TaxID=1263082 RepID=A0A068SDM5_9FUNG|nr:predicted protein [Lichtheimia corymbifera JMRC:FSU:9682]